jgi:hypothetical protein
LFTEHAKMLGQRKQGSAMKVYANIKVTQGEGMLAKQQQGLFGILQMLSVSLLLVLYVNVYEYFILFPIQRETLQIIFCQRPRFPHFELRYQKTLYRA